MWERRGDSSKQPGWPEKGIGKGKGKEKGQKGGKDGKGSKGASKGTQQKGDAKGKGDQKGKGKEGKGGKAQAKACAAADPFATVPPAAPAAAAMDAALLSRSSLNAYIKRASAKKLEVRSTSASSTRFLNHDHLQAQSGATVNMRLLIVPEQKARVT